MNAILTGGILAPSACAGYGQPPNPKHKRFVRDRPEAPAFKILLNAIPIRSTTTTSAIPARVTGDPTSRGVNSGLVFMAGVELEVEAASQWGDQRYETKDKNGKPTYMKKFYVANVTLEVTCKYPVDGKEPVTVTLTHEWKDEVQASAMDELM